MKKSTLILFSLLAGILIAGLCAGVIGMDLMRKQDSDRYEAEVAAGWRLSVAELSEALGDLETDLQKGLYASGDYQTVSWAARVFAEAGAARTALEALPIYELRLQNTETFLNQVGEFTLEMARKQMRGEELNESEEASLKNLALRSRELADEVLSLSEKIADENPDFSQMQEYLLPSEEGEDQTVFESLEGIFSGDEPLVYDGDFSAWYANRTSPWLETLDPLHIDDILARGADALGVADGELQETGRFDTPFSFVEFTAGDKTVAVTGRGGMIYGFSRMREVNESKLIPSDAVARATKSLENLGYPSMEPIAWSRSENTVSAVYALRQNGVLIYGDRITATVALDNGEILALNAAEYLFSHNPDRTATPTVTANEAAQVLRQGLTVEATALVSLPGGDGSEKLCWQFTVRDGSEAKVMVFVNAHTKVEEDILLLLEGEDFLRAE